jgi:hypothetical protein
MGSASEVLQTPLKGLLSRLLRTDCPESTPRALALLAGITLCFCLVVLTLAVWYEAVMNGHVDTGLVAALSVISGSVAILAGAVHRQAEPQEPAS